MDQVKVLPSFTSPISLPQELFEQLPAKESDLLQKELMDIYFNDNPRDLQQIISVSENDENTIDMKKEMRFNQVLNEDYGFEVEILRGRRNDKISDILVSNIDKYNQQVELIS